MSDSIFRYWPVVPNTIPLTPEAAMRDYIDYLNAGGDRRYRPLPPRNAEEQRRHKEHWARVYALEKTLADRAWVEYGQFLWRQERREIPARQRYGGMMPFDCYDEAKRIVSVEEEAALWRAAYGEVQLENERDA